MGAYANILGDEVLRSEVVHKVLSCNETTIFVVLLHDDLLKLLVGGLHNLFEFKCHRLAYGRCTNVLVELLVDFLNHAFAPASNLIVDQLYFLLGFTH